MGGAAYMCTCTLSWVMHEGCQLCCRVMHIRGAGHNRTPMSITIRSGHNHTSWP